MEGIGKTPLSRERRRHKRFDLSRALAYRWGLAKGTLRTVDLSLGGVKIQTDSPIPVGGRVDLIILLEYEAIKPVGRVVRLDPASNQKYDVGICFETISHQCLKRLERFLQVSTLRDERAKREKGLHQSDLKGLKSKSFELDRLKANFLRWLHESYPRDYQRFAHRPVIGELEITDFLVSKGIDKLDAYYLLKSLRGK